MRICYEDSSWIVVWEYVTTIIVENLVKKPSLLLKLWTEIQINIGMSHPVFLTEKMNFHPMAKKKKKKFVAVCYS